MRGDLVGRRIRIGLVAAVLLLCFGCVGEDATPGDGGSEFGPDGAAEGAVDGSPDVGPDSPFDVPDAPGPDATCDELSEYLAVYSAAHRSCSSAEECELAVNYEPGTEFCYFVFGIPEFDDRMMAAALRSDAVSPEFADARRRFESTCYPGLGWGRWACVIDACGVVRIQCSSGQCVGLASTTACPCYDGGWCG
jgi:hypothetical protein